MITEIGIVAGRILELLEKRNGALVLGEIHSNLNESSDLVLMSLGGLLYKGYICIMEDPLRAIFQHNDNKKIHAGEVCMFDLVIRNNADEISGKILKNMSGRIGDVAGKIMTLLEGCGDLLALQTIECHIKEHRDIVLMGLGWLIREGYVRGIAGNKETFIFRLTQKTFVSNMEVFSHV